EVDDSIVATGSNTVDSSNRIPTACRGGQLLDLYGGIHEYGYELPSSGGTGYWLGQDVARAIAVRADGVSGYVLDRQGGLHEFGGAPAVIGTSWFPGEDQAVDIGLRPDGTSGWVL